DEIRQGTDRTMNIRVDAAVQRNHATRAEQSLQIGKGFPTGVTQNQIEIDESTFADVGERLSLFPRLERYRRVEVVKHAQRHFGIEHEVRSGDSVGTVRC